MVDELIADLKDAISEAKLAPTGKGTMVMLYGACHRYFYYLLCFGRPCGCAVGQATSADELTCLLDVCRAGPVEPRWADDGRARRGGVLGHHVQSVRFESRGRLEVCRTF